MFSRPADRRSKFEIIRRFETKGTNEIFELCEPVPEAKRNAVEARRISSNSSNHNKILRLPHRWWKRAQDDLENKNNSVIARNEAGLNDEAIQKECSFLDCRVGLCPPRSDVKRGKPFNLQTIQPFNTLTRQCAFTLAEVLITLGIIGIVAAMTIPALMQNIQDRQFKEAAKKAYSVCSSVIQQMVNDNGSNDFSSYLDRTPPFIGDFKQYFKIIKDCGNASCVPGNSTKYMSLSGDVFNASYFDDGQFITTDGMFFAVENPDNVPSLQHIWISVDVNGYDNNPNVLGKDVFAFQIINGRLLPMGAEQTNFSASTYCNRTVHSHAQGYGCMAKVMQGLDY